MKLDQYENACRTLENFFIWPQGVATRRPGTQFIARVKDAATPVRLSEFSTEQAYVVEAGSNYFRFYKDGGRIEEPAGTPVEIWTPYEADDLARLKWAQSADVLYLVDGWHSQQKLMRSSHVDWTLATVEFTDGRYMQENTDTGQTLTPAAATGTGITISAGGSVAINGCWGTADGVIKVQTSSARHKESGDQLVVSGVGGTTEANGTWTIDKVSANQLLLRGSSFVRAYTSGGSITFAPFVAENVGRLVHQAFEHLGLCRDHPVRLGDAGQGDGEERVRRHHGELRLALRPVVGCARLAGGGALSRGTADLRRRPVVAAAHRRLSQRRLRELTPGVNDNDPISYTIAADQVNAIHWLESWRYLVVGTQGGECRVGSSNTTTALTPTNVQIRRETKQGCADLAPAVIGNTVVFLQRQGRKPRALEYKLETDSLVAADITLLAEHVTRGGIKELAYQQEPASIQWACRNDGLLIGCTYLASQAVTAWHRHPLGGTGAAVESVCVIPGAAQDELWLATRRPVNGVTLRSIERVAPPLADDDAGERPLCRLRAAVAIRRGSRISPFAAAMMRSTRPSISTPATRRCRLPARIFGIRRCGWCRTRPCRSASRR